MITRTNSVFGFVSVVVLVVACTSSTTEDTLEPFVSTLTTNDLIVLESGCEQKLLRKIDEIEQEYSEGKVDYNDGEYRYRSSHQFLYLCNATYSETVVGQAVLDAGETRLQGALLTISNDFDDNDPEEGVYEMYVFVNDKDVTQQVYGYRNSLVTEKDQIAVAPFFADVPSNGAFKLGVLGVERDSKRRYASNTFWHLKDIVVDSDYVEESDFADILTGRSSDTTSGAYRVTIGSRSEPSGKTTLSIETEGLKGPGVLSLFDMEEQKRISFECENKRIEGLLVFNFSEDSVGTELDCIIDPHYLSSTDGTNRLLEKMMVLLVTDYFADEPADTLYDFRAIHISNYF